MFQVVYLVSHSLLAPSPPFFTPWNLQYCAANPEPCGCLVYLLQLTDSSEMGAWPSVTASLSAAHRVTSSAVTSSPPGNSSSSSACVGVQTSELSGRLAPAPSRGYAVQFISIMCLQCSDAVGWAAGRASVL